MNSDINEGKWHQLKGKIKEEWNELTNDEIEASEGRAEQLAGQIQQRYGVARDEAKKRIRELADTV